MLDGVNLRVQNSYVVNGITLYAYTYNYTNPSLENNKLESINASIVSDFTKYFSTSSPIIYINASLNELQHTYFTNGTITDDARNANLVIATLNSSGSLDIYELNANNEMYFEKAFSPAYHEGVKVTLVDALTANYSDNDCVVQNVFYCTEPITSYTLRSENDFYAIINGKFTSLRDVLTTARAVQTSNGTTYLNMYEKIVNDLTSITTDEVNVNYNKTEIQVSIGINKYYITKLDKSLAKIYQDVLDEFNSTTSSSVTLDDIGLTDTEIKNSIYLLNASKNSELQSAYTFQVFTSTYNGYLSEFTPEFDPQTYEIFDEILLKHILLNSHQLYSTSISYNEVAPMIILTGSNSYESTQSYLSSISEQIKNNNYYMDIIETEVEKNGDELLTYSGIYPYLANSSVPTTTPQTKKNYTAISEGTTISTLIQYTSLLGEVQDILGKSNNYTVSHKLTTILGTTVDRENSPYYILADKNIPTGYKIAFNVDNATISGTIAITNSSDYIYYNFTFEPITDNTLNFTAIVTTSPIQYFENTSSIENPTVPTTGYFADYISTAKIDYSNVTVATPGEGISKNGQFMYAIDKSFTTLSAVVTGRTTLNAYFKGASYILEINVYETNENYDPLSGKVGQLVSYKDDLLQESGNTHINTGFSTTDPDKQYFVASHNDLGKIETYKFNSSDFGVSENGSISKDQLKSYIYDFNGNLLTPYTPIYVVSTTSNPTYSKLNAGTSSKYIYIGAENSYGGYAEDTSQASTSSDFYILQNYKNSDNFGFVFTTLQTEQFENVNGVLKYKTQIVRGQTTYSHPFATSSFNNVLVMLFKTNDKTKMFEEGNYVILGLSANGYNSYTLNSSIQDINEYIDEFGKIIEDRIQINTSNASKVQYEAIKTTDSRVASINEDTLIGTTGANSTNFKILAKVTAVPSSGYPSIQILLNKDTSSSTAVTNGLQRNSSFYNAYYYKDSGIDQITKFTYGNYKAFNNSIISDTFGNITSTAYDVRVDASFLIKAVALEINLNTEGTSTSGLGYLNEPTYEDYKLFDDNATYQNTNELIQTLLKYALEGNTTEYKNLTDQLSTLFSNYSIYKFKGANNYLSWLEDIQNMLELEGVNETAINEYNNGNGSTTTIMNQFGLYNKIYEIMLRDLQNQDSDINTILKNFLTNYINARIDNTNFTHILLSGNDLVTPLKSIAVNKIEYNNNDWTINVTYNYKYTTSTDTGGVDIIVTDSNIDKLLEDLIGSVNTTDDTFTNSENFFNYYYLCAIIEIYAKAKDIELFEDEAKTKYNQTIINTIQAYSSALAVQDYINNFSNYYNNVLYDLISTYAKYKSADPTSQSAYQEDFYKVVISAYLAYGLVFDDYTFTSGSIIFFDLNKLVGDTFPSENIKSYEGYLNMTYNQLVRILTEVKNNMSSIMYLDRFGAQVSIGFSVIDLVKSVVDYATTASTVTSASAVIEYTNYYFDLNSDKINAIKSAYLDENNEAYETERTVFGKNEEGFKSYFIEGFKQLVSKFDVVTENSENGSWTQYIDFTKYTKNNTKTYYNSLTLLNKTLDNKSYVGIASTWLTDMETPELSKIYDSTHTISWDVQLYSLDPYYYYYEYSNNNSHTRFYKVDKIGNTTTIEMTSPTNYEVVTSTIYNGVVQDTVIYDLLQEIINTNQLGNSESLEEVKSCLNGVRLDSDANYICIKSLTRIAYGKAINENNNYPWLNDELVDNDNSLKNVIDLSSHNNSLRDKTMDIANAYNNQSSLYYLMNSELNAKIYALQLEDMPYIENLDNYIANYAPNWSLGYAGQNIKGDGLLDELAKLLGKKKLEAVDFQTKLTTYVLSAYELLNCDLSANYNDLIVTNIDLKEQVQLGNLSNEVEKTNFGDKFTYTVDKFFGNDELKVVSKDFKYSESRDDAPTGYYFVNNVSSDYSYQKQTTSLQNHKITSEEFSAYNELNNNTDLKASLSDNAFVSALTSAQQYFYPYLSNSSARGANYISPSSNYLQSINVKTNHKDFAQNQGDTYSLKVVSYVAVNDKVLNNAENPSPLIDFNNSNGISTLTNEITIGAEGQASSYNDEIKDRSIIRRIGLAWNNEMLLTASEYIKLGIITGITIFFAVVLIVAAVVAIVASGGTATGPVLGATFKILTVIGQIASILKLFTTAIKIVITVVKVIIAALPIFLKIVAISAIIGIIYTSVTNSIISKAWQNNQNYGKVTAPKLITNADPSAYREF